MKTNPFAKAALSVAVTVVLMGCDHEEHEYQGMTMVGRFAENQKLDEGIAEIVTYHGMSQSIFVVNSDANTVDQIDASNLTDQVLENPASASNLSLLNSVSVQADVDSMELGVSLGGVNSVAIRGDLMVVAVAAEVKQDPGYVAFYRLANDGAATFLRLVQVGALPDNVVITHSGSHVLVANEGEPSKDYQVDPMGSISIIELDDEGIPASKVKTASFIEFNQGGEREFEMPDGVRVFGPNASVAQDLEPEYIAVDAESEYAYVSLQENNAVAVIDIEEAEVEKIFALGVKDYGLEGNGIDASNKDDAINIQSWNGVVGMYQPDTIAVFDNEDGTFFVTANEGDARSYYYDATEEECLAAGNDFDDEDGCESFDEETRAKKVTVTQDFPQTQLDVEDEAKLGRLKITKTEGKNSEGEYETLFSFGARSFSIWNGETGQLVFDSGNDFERITAEIVGEQGFNSTDDENDFDDRSDDKGPEPEALAVGEVNGHTYAFIGLERVGGIMVYDIEDPKNPVFREYVNHRDYSVDVETQLELAGDLAPEGMKFVPAEMSPSGIALLIVGNEVSGTTTVYQIQ